MALKKLTRLRERRERRGLVQEDLAALTGISRSTIAELETGPRKARPETAAKLARALKVKPEALF